MQQINDLYSMLDGYLSQQPLIQQCLITEYVVNDETNEATCKVLLPNTDGATIEIPNVTCYVGSAIKIDFQDFMHGILLRSNTRFMNANDISNGVLTQSFDYFSPIFTNLVAIIIPHNDTIDNILRINMNANESFKATAPKVYVGSTETNVLDELVEYLALLKDFFQKLSQNAPTLSAQPASGSAQLQSDATEMTTKTDEIYQKLTEITKFNEE